MRRFAPFSLLLAALVLHLGAIPALAADKSGKEILDYIDDLFRGDSSEARLTMRVKTEHWERTLELEAWSKGKEKSLIRILSPKKEEGTATLKSGNDLWNYLPKVNRVIKLPSSMMSGSWMGSHFTNDDLVKESRMAEDYNFEITFGGERDGENIIEITCIPKPEAAIVWGKVVVIVDGETYIPKRIDYYDEDMELARTLTYSDPKQFGDRTLPSKLVIAPEDKPGESTTVIYEDISFNIGVPESKFSLRELRR